MKLKVILEEGAYMPVKAYETDAGFDLKSPVDAVIEPYSSVTIDTGVHMEIPAGYVGFLKSKSGLNVKYGLNSEGVIDAGYTGCIVCKIYNHTGVPYSVQAGDKISQIVFLPIPEVELVLADKFETSKRGNNGFGSSGR